MAVERPFAFSRICPRALPLCAALLGGAIFAMVLPTTLAAEDSPAAKAGGTQPLVSATTTSKPAAKSKEVTQAEEVARVLEFFKQNQPDAYDKAVKLRATDPAKFEQLIRPAIPIVNALEDIKKTNPTRYALKVEDYQLTYQIHNKVQDLHRADLAANEREAILADLTARVTRQFEVGQLIRQQEIADIQQRVEKLQAQLADRETNKDKTIKRKIEDLAK